MYANIYDMDNLYKASHNALKNKKSKHSPAKFWLNEDRELLKIHQELKEKCYEWGGYSSFILNDQGVERRISVAPFRDRVLHHAIMQNIEPLFEKSFIYDSYAELQGVIKKVEAFLVGYRVKIHPSKIKLLKTQTGFTFLGYKVFKTHFRLTSKAIRRGRKKLKKVKYSYAYGKINLVEAKNKIFGSIGFFKMGSNGKIVDELLAQTVLIQEHRL